MSRLLHPDEHDAARLIEEVASGEAAVFDDAVIDLKILFESVVAYNLPDVFDRVGLDLLHVYSLDLMWGLPQAKEQINDKESIYRGANHRHDQGSGGWAEGCRGLLKARVEPCLPPSTTWTPVKIPRFDAPTEPVFAGRAPGAAE